MIHTMEWSHCVLSTFILIFHQSHAIDKATKSPRVNSLHITSEIKYRFASTLISSQLANEGTLPTKAVYDVIVPSEAFISNFSLEMDNQVYTGTVKEKGVGRERFTRGRGQTQSTGRISRTRPRDTNFFSVEVTIAPRSTVTVHLTYQEVLQRRLGSYKHVIYINPGQPVPDLTVDVTIQESRDLTLLRVLPFKNRNLVTDIDITESNDDAVVSRPSGNTAYIRYNPPMKTQVDMGEGWINTPFVVEYDVTRDKDAGDVLVVNGYFVHFFAPKIDNAVPKDILFILDTSSSMAVDKMEQLRSAMMTILQDLRAGDRFNIMEFNTLTNFWQTNQMVGVTRETVQAAMGFVSRLFSTGATNINDALVNGIDFMNRYANENRSLIVFLTDGQASTGLTSNHAILSNVRSRNIFEIPIYSLAFGSDADWSFVKTVAIQNNGIGRRITEESDAAIQITGFYNEISTPILSDVEFHYLEDTANATTVTQYSFRNYFNGSEVVVAGQLTKEDDTVLSLVVSGNNAGGEVDLKLKARTEELRPSDEPSKPREITPYENLTEKMWAYLTIKDLLRRHDGEFNRKDRELLRKKAVELSIKARNSNIRKLRTLCETGADTLLFKSNLTSIAVKYNFVTPVTSMVVVQYEDGVTDESVLEDERPLADVFTIHHGGWNTRGGRDPHFMVKTVWLDDQICFDVKGRKHDIYQIIHDPEVGLTVNILLKPGNLSNGHGGKRTYITGVAILLNKLVLIANQNGVTINNRKYAWNEEILHTAPPAVITSQHNTGSVRLELKGGFSVTIFKHVPAESRGDEFLNLELDREGKLSRNASGLLGQFVHKRITMKKPYTVANKTMAQLEIRTLHGVTKGLAELQMRMDPVLRTMSRCWLLHSGKGIFAIPQKYFLRKTMKSL